MQLHCMSQAAAGAARQSAATCPNLPQPAPTCTHLHGASVLESHAHGARLLLQRPDLAADVAQVGLEAPQHALHLHKDAVAVLDLQAKRRLKNLLPADLISLP